MKKGTIAVLGGLTGSVIGAVVTGALCKNNVESKDIEKFRSYYNMTNQWLCLKQENKNLSEYFKRNNYSRIAIYGLGEMGNRLMEELKGTDIEIVYAIDQNADYVFSDTKIYSSDSIDSITEEVDVIVVTPIFAFDEIEEKIGGKLSGKVISLEDIVFDM